MVLNEGQIDALTECINIGMGHAAGTLHDMLGAHINLRVPRIVVVPIDQVTTAFAQEQGFDVSAVRMKFAGAFQGSAVLLFPNPSAQKLVQLLTGADEPTDDTNVLRSGTLIEVGNIILNGVMGSIVNLMKSPLQFVVPYYTEGRIEQLLHSFAEGQSTHLIIASTTFESQARAINGYVVIVFEIPFIQELAQALDRMVGGP